MPVGFMACGRFFVYDFGYKKPLLLTGGVCAARANRVSAERNV